MIHGDTNPEGPGYKEEEIQADCNKSYPGRNQRIHGGSYVIVPQDERLNVESFTLQCYIFPTTPVVGLGTPQKGRQGVLTKWVEESKSGYGLFIDEHNCLSVEIGDGSGQIMKLSSDKNCYERFGILRQFSYDARTGKVTLFSKSLL